MKLAHIIMISLLLGACGDFRQENLTEGPKVTQQTIEQALLSSPDSINEGEFTLKKMVANMAANIIAPTVNQFADHTRELENKVDLLCSLTKAQSQESELALNNAQDSWKKAMTIFHQLELMQIGTLKGSIQDLYSWPQFNSCRAALEAGFRVPRQGDNYSHTDSPNLNGLDVLEFYLFANFNQHNCPASHGARLQSWLEKTDNQKRVDQCKVMLPAAQKLNNKAKALEQQWSVYGENYSAVLLKQDIPQVVGLITDHMQVYIDQFIKEFRLARPLGIKGCQDSTSCIKDLEHLYSDYAFEAIKQNILSFQKLFLGTTFRNHDGFGLDDFFNAKGLEELTIRTKEKMKIILEQIEVLESQGHFSALLAQKEQSCDLEGQNPLCVLHQQVDQFDDILKIDFLNALSELSIPKIPQGDGD